MDKEVWEQKIKWIMQTLQLNMRIFFHSSAFGILSRDNTSLIGSKWEEIGEIWPSCWLHLC